MDHSKILVKTPKAHEEIKNRAFNLSHSLRHLLILIDEHSTVGELLDGLGGQGGDLEAQIETLLAQGFLAPHATAYEMGAYSIDDWEMLEVDFPEPRDMAPAGVAITEHARFNLDKAKAHARYVVLGSLGPVAAHRIERIEAAKNVGELRAELDDLRDALPKLLSKHQAKEVWHQLEPLMLSVS